MGGQLVIGDRGVARAPRRRAVPAAALLSCLLALLAGCGDSTTSADSPVSAQVWNTTVARDSAQLTVAEHEAGPACSADQFADSCAQAVTTMRNDCAAMLHDLYNTTPPAGLVAAQAKFESGLQKFQQAATDTLTAIHDRSTIELTRASTEGLASETLITQAGQLVPSPTP